MLWGESWLFLTGSQCPQQQQGQLLALSLDGQHSADELSFTGNIWGLMFKSCLWFIFLDHSACTRLIQDSGNAPWLRSPANILEVGKHLHLWVMGLHRHQSELSLVYFSEMEPAHVFCVSMLRNNRKGLGHGCLAVAINVLSRKWADLVTLLYILPHFAELTRTLVIFFFYSVGLESMT